jgi:RNA polymerase sigma factor (sigma-70 family)
VAGVSAMSTERQTPSDAFQFANTHWSVVLEARAHASAEAGDALERLCRTYWFPLYAYVRRYGYSPADAEDLTQEFFARFLAKNFLASVDPAKGKFRAFLLASLKHFLANEWDRATAQKRGGGTKFIPFDELRAAETCYAEDSLSTSAPQLEFERRWALTVMDRALTELKTSYIASGKCDQYELLKRFLSAEATDGYREVAAQLEMKEATVAVAVHRLRQRYRDLLREQIAQTVSSPAEIEGEMHHLFAVLNG